MEEEKPSMELIREFQLDKKLVPESSCIGLKKLLNNYDKILGNQKALMNLMKHSKWTRRKLVEKAKIKVNQRLGEQGYIDFSDNKSCGLNNNSEIIIPLSNEKPKIEQIGDVS